MGPRAKRALKERVRTRVARSRGDVFVVSDFADLSGRVQVQRALKQLVDEGRLARIGYGLYARTRVSTLTGEPILAGNGGFRRVAELALDRLGVAWSPSERERAFAEGRSHQIPVRAAIRIRGRFARRLAYKGMVMRFERERTTGRYPPG